MSETTEYLPGADEAAPETETPVETTALAVVKPESDPPQSKLEVRDAGLRAYLASALSRAGTLQLTPEESKTLKEPFGDECFITGAAGDDALIYVSPRTCETGWTRHSASASGLLYNYGTGARSTKPARGSRRSGFIVRGR